MVSYILGCNHLEQGSKWQMLSINPCPLHHRKGRRKKMERHLQI